MSSSETDRFLLRLAQHTEVEGLWQDLQDWMADHGFDRLMYAATRFRTNTSMGDLRDARILTNYPKSFTEPYLEGGMFYDAPMVRWAMENVGTLSWSVIAQDAMAGRLPPECMRVVEFNRRQGVVAGYGISFPRVSARTGHGIGIASSTRNQAEVNAIWAENGGKIELVAHVAHLTLLSLPHGLHGRTLTRRQREVLELVADGKTIQDVALVLGRNPTTIEKHLRLAREALDVETTAQAILKAGLQNQFFRLDA
ncbi:LuxR family transcriptional regulator [uncultured Jannaschia sp.]|uniref:LuxR family transcriptional regulator n=1 Tax=uncultured Jannaschia sp. TaxID=293347 RepID=UPI0026282EA7|nr:LuxR family transcriptional regulator [uncultured Jannaschia sp.]